MTYTPVELRHVRVGRSLFGYNRAAVEQVIEEVAQSFETTWRERGELAEKVEQLEKQLGEHKRREELLTHTLVAAEQAASDVRERARREADGIIVEAHSEARAIGRSAHAKRERLLAESQRIEAMLRAALGVIEEGTTRMAPTTLEPKSDPLWELGPVGGQVADATSSHAPTPVLPPVIEDAPAPPETPPAPTDDWREDTREFVPIVAVEGGIEEPEPEPADQVPPEPVLQRTPGRESRDFDWGE